MKPQNRKESICGVCVENPKHAGALMCPECQKNSEEQARRLRGCLIEPETELQYALRCAEENWVYFEEELRKAKWSAQTYWDSAFIWVRGEHRGMRIEPNVFLNLVKEKFREILEKAGLIELDNTICQLGEKLKILDHEIYWLKKQTEAEKSTNGAQNVVQKPTTA